MGLSKTDPQVYKLIKEEEKRQREVLEMIPSENYASRAVMEALGTVLTNKYSEGYPKKRYYQGNRVIDEIEQLAIDRAKKLFGVPYVNVQALSGSPANTAVYFALLTPLKDKIMGLSMASGGHLTHGLALNISGRFYKSSLYELGKDGQLDYAAIEKQAVREKPKIIICGYTAFPRIIDFKKFGQIADKVGAFLMADISHITGLVVAEKGFKKDPDLGRKIDSAIIPGLQGGPHDNQTAAIAVALKEASAPAFKKYGHQIVKNSKALAKALIKYGFDLLSGGSDNHLILIDLQNKKANGAVAAFALEVANIVVNKNLVLNDPMPSFYPSGIRLGTPAITTRGMKEKEMTKIAGWYSQVIDKVKNEQLPQEKEARVEFMKSFRQKAAKNKKLLQIAHEVKALTQKFPV